MARKQQGDLGANICMNVGEIFDPKYFHLVCNSTIIIVSAFS